AAAPKPDRSIQREHNETSTAQQVPPAFLHSSSARSSASRLALAVPQVTTLPSCTSAPQELANHAQSLHSEPCFTQLSIATFLALSKSAMPRDQPTPLSLAL